MKNACILFLLLAVLTQEMLGQTAHEPYSFSAEIASRLAQDTNLRHLQHYAIDYMEIGAYANMLATDEQFVQQYSALKSKPKEVLASFSTYTPVEALPAIVELAKQHRIVILNEAHYSAQNRMFTATVAEALRAYGFTTLFLEGLHPDKSEELMASQIPFISAGALLREPQYGNLVRRAFAQGFTILPYDHDQDSTIADPLVRWYSREEGQARTVMQYLEANPEEKIIIHCGYGHLSETIFEGEIVGNMAAIIKSETGLDPLTIRQDEWLETFSEATANPYRLQIEAQDAPTEISVFQNRSGDYFSSHPDSHDLNVYFPPTRYSIGRPHWLFSLSNKRGVSVPQVHDSLEAPYLVRAYHAGEEDAGVVPVDVWEVQNSEERNFLALEPGDYLLIINDAKGQEQRLPLQVD